MNFLVTFKCRLHCYMYFLDSKSDIDTSRVFRTENFDLQRLRRLRKVHNEGQQTIPP